MPASKNTLRRHGDCLTVLCPLTKSSIPTLIGTDVRTLAKAWHTKSRSHVLTAGRFTCTGCAKRLWRQQFQMRDLEARFPGMVRPQIP